MKFKFNGWSVFLMLTVASLFFVFSSRGKTDTKIEAFPDDEIVFPENLLDASGNLVSIDDVKSKYIGLYFSASWCGPCRKFTPKLIDFRNKFSEEFEVILIGADGSAKAQANYMKKYSMPWLAMENQSAQAKHASELSGVEYIPYLVILDSKGNIITKDGKNHVMKMGEKALEYWKDL